MTTIGYGDITPKTTSRKYFNFYKFIKKNKYSFLNNHSLSYQKLKKLYVA